MVTGGAGFIGHHLVNRLLENYKVAIVDNLSGGNNIIKHQNTSFYKEDVRNTETLKEIIKREKIDSCIHLAARISIRESESETVSTNVDGTLSVLNACVENEVKNFVLASSAAVYGEAKFLPITEDHPLNPISQYGASKIEAEKIVVSFKKSNRVQNAVCLRLFNVYGAGQNMEYAGVITKFADRIRNKLSPIIYGNGEQTRDFISVRDAVNAIVLSLQISGTFNIGTGHPVSIRQLADKMLKITPLNIGPIYQQRNMENEIKHSVADTSKAAQILKFVAKDKLDDSLKSLMFSG